jgi:flagellar biosynthesis protein FliQ
MIILQAQHANDIFMDHKNTIGNLLSNTSVVLFAIVYGISVGVFDAICTFLSQYLPYDPKECGYVGLLFVLVGFLGSFLVAYCMDSFPDRSIYWTTTFGATLGCAISMIYLWLTVWLAVDSRLLVYSAIIFNGIFLSALISAGFEYGAAITYPSDENVVSGLLNCFSHIIAWALIECKEYISPSSPSSLSSSTMTNDTTITDIPNTTTNDKNIDMHHSTNNNFFAYNAFLSSLLVATCFLFFYYIQGESKRPLEDLDDTLSEEEEEVFIRQG